MKVGTVGLITILTLGILGALAAAAQQPPRVARIGWMSLATPTAPAPFLEAFRQGMRDLGYVEGQNFVLEPRYTGGKNELLPEQVADLSEQVMVLAGGAGGVIGSEHV